LKGLYCADVLLPQLAYDLKFSEVNAVFNNGYACSCYCWSDWLSVICHTKPPYNALTMVLTVACEPSIFDVACVLFHKVYASSLGAFVAFQDLRYFSNKKT
jgi:hypothetical protein